MIEVSQIEICDEVYDLKDAEARSQIEGLSQQQQVITERLTVQENEQEWHEL